MTVEQFNGILPGALIQPDPPAVPVYRAPVGYEVGLPEPGEEHVLAEVHALAYKEAYCGRVPGGTPEALETFIRDPRPGSFGERTLTRWRGLIAGEQPNPNAYEFALVARERRSGAIVAIGSGSRPHDYYMGNYSMPMDRPGDRITALFVRPDHQGRYVGSALLAALMTQLDTCVCLETVPGTRAVEFYKSHGFRERKLWLSGQIGRVLPYGIRLPRIAMSCETNPYASSAPERAGTGIHSCWGLERHTCTGLTGAEA